MSLVQRRQQRYNAVYHTVGHKEGVMQCPQCQQVLPPEANFCTACGHNVATIPQPAQTSLNTNQSF
ncbi:MAG: zinc ribbon domain-containing protein [bacterium]|nr:zinc ribbon domain-containing protein [bacterium]